VSAPLDRSLAALADPQRRRVVDLLGVGPRRAGQLADEVGVPAPTMSRHLRALREAGLVEESPAELDARVRIYRHRPGGMDELKTWLEQAERGWVEQLSALRTHLGGEG
jgi:DNA-binding transcriptional ArsR family regulator